MLTFFKKSIVTKSFLSEETTGEKRSIDDVEKEESPSKKKKTDTPTDNPPVEASAEA